MPLTRANQLWGFNRNDYANQVLFDFPEIYFPFDGDGTIALDHSGYARHGTYLSANRVGFTNPITDKRGFSVEAIIRISSNTLAGSFLSVGATSGLSLGVGANGQTSQVGNDLVGVANGYAWIGVAAAIGLGLHQIALTVRDDGYMLFFIDGRPVNRQNPYYIAPNNQGFINGYHDGSGFLSGVTFEAFSLYAVELPPDRINSHWKAAQLGV